MSELVLGLRVVDDRQRQALPKLQVFTSLDEQCGGTASDSKGNRMTQEQFWHDLLVLIIGAWIGYALRQNVEEGEKE